MIISKQDEIKLNTLAHGAGAEAIEFLGAILYDYYATQTVMCPDDKEMNSGKAQLAQWLKGLPKGLQDGHATQHV